MFMFRYYRWKATLPVAQVQLIGILEMLMVFALTTSVGMKVLDLSRSNHGVLLGCSLALGCLGVWDFCKALIKEGLDSEGGEGGTALDVTLGVICLSLAALFLLLYLVGP